MRVTFLGTGAAMPTGERVQTGIVLEDGDDVLLVDCGSGVLHSLQREGPGYEAVDALLLTHHHLDHVSDLMVLLKARWLAGETDLEIVGPPGTEELVDGLFDVHEYMQDRFELTVREVDPDASASEVAEFELAGFEVEALKTIHSTYCLAYRFDDRFAFGGDSEAFVGLAEFVDEAAVVALDCSFPDEIDVSNHGTPTELGETLAAADADVGRLYLTHLYPHADGKHEEMLDALTDEYDVEARMASDGLSIAIDEAR